MEYIRKKFDVLRGKLTAKGLNDPRILGIVLLAIIGLSVLWNGARVVQQNYTLLQKIALLEEQNSILELENRNREIQIEYFKTPEFAELKARRVNGKAAPGEQVYIVTDETALSSLKTLNVDEKKQEQVEDKPKYQQNFEAWIDFFFGN
jgi:cell division protein FtsB